MRKDDQTVSDRKRVSPDRRALKVIRISHRVVVRGKIAGTRRGVTPASLDHR